MRVVKKIWKKITPTNALDESGELEIAFFEDVYRVAYAAGLSATDRTVPYLIYSTTVKLLIAMLMCAEVGYAFSQELSLDEVAASVNVTLIQIITLYKVKNMITYKDLYQKLARCMDNSYFDITTIKRRQLMKHWAKTHQRYVKLLLLLGNCTLIAWHLYPFLDEVDYNMMIGIRLPYRFDSSLRYPFTYIIVGIAFIYISHFVMVTDLVMQAHLVPLICQLSVLADCFENIAHDCQVATELQNETVAAWYPRILSSMTSRSKLVFNKLDACSGDLILTDDFIREYLRRLGSLVEQHQLILNYSMNFKVILSGPMLGQIAASGTLICCIGYQALTTIETNLTKGFMSLFYLGYNLFGIFIICRWCEEITVQSRNIGEAVYSSGWESGIAVLPGVRSTILLVIARANKPLVFTAGGMYNLSLQSFSTLVKTSYSALTVMLRFRHE